VLSNQRRYINRSSNLPAIAGLVIVLLTLLSSVPFKANAEPAPAVKLTGTQPSELSAKPFFKLDGRPYPENRLLYDFVQVAFPRHLWMEDTLDPARALFQSRDKWDQLRTLYPWASEYIFRDHGFPKSDVLNRWSKDITVSLGWPPRASAGPPKNVLERAARANTGRVQDGPADSIIKDQILKLAPQIAAATGIHLSFIEPYNETPSAYANVRIITSGIFYVDNKFKTAHRQDDGSAREFSGVTDFDDRFTEAVRFTPYARAQVDGYFVPDKNNTIDFAVCKLWPNFQPDLLRSLVTECIARSLGLPEMSILDNDAAVGHWDRAHDSETKRQILDGLGVNSTQLKLKPIGADHIGQREETERAQEQLKQQVSHFPDEPLDSDAALLQLKEYDLAMLSILYCKNLSPGMDRGQVIRSLYTSLPSCLSTFKGIQ